MAGITGKAVSAWGLVRSSIFILFRDARTGNAWLTRAWALKQAKTMNDAVLEKVRSLRIGRNVGRERLLTEISPMIPEMTMSLLDCIKRFAPFDSLTCTSSPFWRYTFPPFVRIRTLAAAGNENKLLP